MITPAMPYNLIILILIISAMVYDCGHAVMYFVAAFVLSYLLNPAVSRLSSWKIPRSLATLVMITVFLCFFIAVVWVLSPILYKQSMLITQQTASYQGRIKTELVPQFMEWVGGISPALMTKLEEGVTSAALGALGFTGSVISKFIQSAGLAINIASVILLVPIITFYILRDWQPIVAGMFNIVPVRHRAAAAELIDDMDTTMAGYLRGQTYVCLIMGTYYAIALSVMQLDSAIVLGFCSGMLVVIPYVGAVCAGLVCTLIAGLQYGSLYYSAAALGVFIFGNVVESNFISPKLIGDSVGLHPVWLLFGLVVGGSLFGFFGVLVAVPLTAALGTVIKFAIAQYKRSEFYTKG